MINATLEGRREIRIRRIVSVVMIGVGAYLVVTGLVAFFSKINSHFDTPAPNQVWLVMLGLPILGVGVWLMDGAWFSVTTDPVLEIRQVAYDDPDAEALIGEVQEEYVSRYGGPDETPVEPARFLPPEGAFFVGYLDEKPVAMGGWRVRPDVQALEGKHLVELKRMYVRADARRHGLGRQLLARLELTAKVAGADVMILETGTEQPEAVSLYLREGYTSIAPFGHYAGNPKSLSFGKVL